MRLGLASVPCGAKTRRRVWRQPPPLYPQIHGGAYPLLPCHLTID